ncbi:hypothetical protein EB619_21085 [Escherichia coli]|nr:hypothetical protein [Escherichia coli]
MKHLIIMCILILLFLASHFFCIKQWYRLLFTTLIVFTGLFSYLNFGAFFYSSQHPYYVNLYLFLVLSAYFFVFFILFSFLYRFRLVGVLLHSLLMSLVSFLKIYPPLHPFILLYPFVGAWLPRTPYPLLNTFLLFVMSGIVFCNSSMLLKSLVFICVFAKGELSDDLLNKHKASTTPIRVMVIQVGLYFDKGGNTKSFFNDFLSFVRNNPNIDLIVFSENSLFGYKNDFNKELSLKLFDVIRDNNLADDYHFFLGFSGFSNINNIVTLYKHKKIETINQKTTLIPFVEKPGFLNHETPINSKFFHIAPNIHENKFNIFKHKIKTSICYDAFFPSIDSYDNSLVLIQSSYNLLNMGKGYDDLIYHGTLLAKFVVGLHSKYVINIQDHGGTMVIDGAWKTDNVTFLHSKDNPFFIVHLQ